MAHLMGRLATALKLDNTMSMFFYCGARMLRPDVPMKSLESEVSKEDGFLHITA
jgi:hypothetical protein